MREISAITESRTTAARRAKKLLPGVAAALLIVGAVAAPSADAAVTCQRSTVCNPKYSGVNLRVSPSASPPGLYLNHGDGLYINCWQTGQWISGPWGTSNIWDFVSWTSQYGYTYYGYVSDTYVYTGTNGPPPWVARCPNGLRGNI
jgi:uncharacterized protein YraI